MEINKEDALKQYNKNYYETVGKEKYSKPIKCDACNCYIKGWTFNKHMISKKHIFNSSTEEVKKQIQITKELRLKEKRIKKLNEEIENTKIQLTD